jgi:hypothetical protein
MYDEGLLNGELLDLKTLSERTDYSLKTMMMFIFSRDASRGENSLLLRGGAGIMESKSI